MFPTIKEQKTPRLPFMPLPVIPQPPLRFDQQEPFRPRILLALDNKDVATLLKRYLIWSGLFVETATNAEQALKLAFSKSVDLVAYATALSDSSNPLELFTGIRERGGKMPIIVIVEDDFNSGKDFIEKGISAIIKKPLKIAELESKIEKLLNNS